MGHPACHTSTPSATLGTSSAQHDDLSRSKSASLAWFRHPRGADEDQSRAGRPRKCASGTSECSTGNHPEVKLGTMPQADRAPVLIIGIKMTDQINLTRWRLRATSEYQINQVCQIKNICRIAIPVYITFFGARTRITTTPEDKIYQES